MCKLHAIIAGSCLMSKGFLPRHGHSVKNLLRKGAAFSWTARTRGVLFAGKPIGQYSSKGRPFFHVTGKGKEKRCPLLSGNAKRLSPRLKNPVMENISPIMGKSFHRSGRHGDRKHQGLMNTKGAGKSMFSRGLGLRVRRSKPAPFLQAGSGTCRNEYCI